MSPDDMEDLRATLEATVRSAPPPRRWWFDALALGASSFALVALGVAVWMWIEGGQPEPRWQGGLLVAVIVAASVAAIRPGGRALRRTTVALLAAAVVGLVSGQPGPGGHPFLESADCAAGELSMAVVPALVALLALRRFARHGGRALVGGIVAGATGLVVLDLTCALRHPAHVVTFHLVPCVLVVAAVAAARERLRSQTFSP